MSFSCTLNSVLLFIIVIVIVNGVDYYNVVVIQDMHRMGEHAMYGHRQGL